MLTWLSLAYLAAACSGSETGGGPSSGGSSATGGQSSNAGNAGVAGRTPMGGDGGHSSGAGGANGGQTQSAGAGNTTLPASCQSSGSGVSDCGANHEDCCTSLAVPAGTFFRTYTGDASGAHATADPATISGFRLDKYLVTVGRFRKFVAAWNEGEGYTPPAGSGKHGHLNGGRGLADSGPGGAYEPGWSVDDNSKLQLTRDNLACDEAYATWSETPGARDTLPMNCVNWWEAYAFCIWDGGFLPSEAEFTYAAAGGSEQRTYPWGAQAAGANPLYAVCNCNYPQGAGACSGVTNIAPVGSAQLGAARWGHFDLVGDVTEWLLDWMSPSLTTPCTDCADVAEGSGRMIRDGFYSSSDAALLVSYRDSLYPANRFASLGFRCARAPQ